MRIHVRTLLSLVLLLLLPVCTQGQTALVLSSHQRAHILEGYGNLPLAFEANQGQSDSQVKFLSRGAGYGLFLTPAEAVLTLQPSPVSTRDSASAVLRIKLLNASRRTIMSGQDELPGKSNYFIGNDPKKWHTDVRQFAKVSYANVYPGVDLVYYGNQRELEYDFLLQPGANPEQIRLGIEGASKVRVEYGELVLTSAAGDVRLRSPQIYQEVNGVRQNIRGGYVMTGNNEVGFRIASYDHNKALVIDPVIAFGTYLGGSGDDAAMDIAVDSSGNAYVTGYTNSIDFPVANAVQATKGGLHDVFVTKLNTDGSAPVFSTYLGGSGEDGAFGIAAGPAGTVYVFGVTASTDFPTANAIQATNHGGWDAFVTKINAEGNTLLYSTYLGGSRDESDNSQTGKMAVDSAGNAYVTGATSSTDFPVLNAIQPTKHGGWDAFVTKIKADGSALIYSTYLGGSSDDRGYAITPDTTGDAYVTGYTWSHDFPIVNAIQPRNNGSIDIFVTRIDANGSTLVFSTYFGGSGYEWGQRVRVDTSGNIYVGGNTSSHDLLTINAVQPSFGGGDQDGFLLKMKGDGSARLYSTYVGGSGQDLGSDITIDSQGNAYLIGATDSTDFPTVNAVQTANHGARDEFVSEVSADGSAFVFSSYLGGSQDEGWCSWAAPGRGGVAVDPVGNIYIAGCTSSIDFPTSPSGFQQLLKGSSDAFVVKIAPGTPIGTVSPTKLDFGGQLIDTTSPPKRVSLSNTGDAQMTVTSVTATDNFSVQTNKCMNGVKPGSHCDVYVVFSPTKLGALSGTLTFVDNAKNSPQTAALSGRGQSTTSTTLTSAPNPSVLGQNVKLTALVIPTYDGKPSGTVTFYDGTTALGTVALNLGTAQLITSTLAAGSHSLTASYSGDAIFQPSTSSVVTQVVKQKLPTVTNKSTPNPSYVKQDVVFTATVSGIAGFVPTGSITFKQGTLVLATVPLANGQASFTMAFTKAGSFSIVASYSGDQNYLPKNSTAVKQVVKKYTTTTALTSSPNPSRYGQLVTFTATVTTAGPYPPTGKVKFWDGTTGIGTAALSNGVAKLGKSTLAVGTHPITAQYLSDAYNDKSTSPVVNQVVQ